MYNQHSCKYKSKYQKVTTNMLNYVELSLRFRLPPYPPSFFILFLFFTNFIIALSSPTPMLYLLLLFFYGSLMLFRTSTITLHLKTMALVNFILIWAFFNNVLITRQEQNFVFIGVILIFAKQMLTIFVGILKAYFFMKHMEFEDVFWIVQLGTFSQFIKYFTDLRILRFAPSLLRITQHLRVGSRNSYISVVRYCFHFSKELLQSWSPLWVLFSLITAIWDIQNYYFNEFGMARVFQGKGICLYPKRNIMCGFFLVIIFQFGWAWAGKYSTILGVVRKVLWNFLRIECKISDFYYRYAQLQLKRIEQQTITKK